MEPVRIETVEPPFDDPELRELALGLMTRCEAAGVIPPEESITVLGRSSLGRVLSLISQAGLAKPLLTGAHTGVIHTLDKEQLAPILQRLIKEVPEDPL